MLRESCRTFDMAYHNRYQCGLYSQLVLQAYAVVLQCVYLPKSVEIDGFHHFIRYFTQKVRARRICMLRELCRTFDMAHHNQYRCGLHSQIVLQAYAVVLQCVYRPKSIEIDGFHHFIRYFTQKSTCTAAMYAPGIV